VEAAYCLLGFTLVAPHTKLSKGCARIEDVARKRHFEPDFLLFDTNKFLICNNLQPMRNAFG